MAKSKTQLQRESDARRGMKIKAFNLPLEVIEEFEACARAQGMANNALFVAAFRAYQAQQKRIADV